MQVVSRFASKTWEGYEVGLSIPFRCFLRLSGQVVIENINQVQ